MVAAMGQIDVDSDPVDESDLEGKGPILFLNGQFVPVNRLDWM